jgi:hypothetical protein
MNKDQKPNNSECYTPSSEPLRFYVQQGNRACLWSLASSLKVFNEIQ